MEGWGQSFKYASARVQPFGGSGLAEEMNQYTRSSLVMGINFLFFFLGILVVDTQGDTLTFDYTLVLATFLIALLVSIGLSFLNRNPFGGIIIGVSLSGAYWVGFLTSLLIKFRFYSNTDVLRIFGPYALYVTAAFACLGLFFGILGYLSDRLFVENPIIETYAFRDYWSNVYKLGKNARREYDKLDRRLTRAHLSTLDWWRQRVSRWTQLKPELIFVGSTSSQPQRTGDVYDASSGKMLYRDVVDPGDLLGVYKPTIVKVPKTSSTAGGGRRLATEELISRLLGWLIQGKVIWSLYIATSALFTYSIYAYFDALVKSTNSILFQTDIAALLITGATLSALTLYFVYRFRSLSKTLYEKRPDERLMVFAIYLILFMFYGLYYQVITSMDASMLNSVSLFDIGVGPWITAMKWFLLFTAVLALTYIFIHRECELTNIYLYDNCDDDDNPEHRHPFRDDRDRPHWPKNDGVAQYWVLRFMYFWSYELTLIPHPDWERVEVWVDSKTGDAKWVVSDYHFRELWYKVEGDLSRKGLQVGFLANFHTPLPFVTEEELERFEKVLGQSKAALLKILMGGKLQLDNYIPKRYVEAHPPSWVERYGLKGIAASFCSDLNWCYWRYPWGIDNLVKYAEHPSALSEEQPGFQPETI